MERGTAGPGGNHTPPIPAFATFIAPMWCRDNVSKVSRTIANIFSQPKKIKELVTDFCGDLDMLCTGMPGML